MRSSSSLLEIVFVTDTVQLYMIGSAWDYISIIMMKVIKTIMIMIMMIREHFKNYLADFFCYGGEMKTIYFLNAYHLGLSS